MRAVCFDFRAGICCLVEIEKRGKFLQHLAWLVALQSFWKIYYKLFVSSDSPEIGLFKRFREKSAHIEKKHFKKPLKNQMWTDILRSNNTSAWCRWVCKGNVVLPSNSQHRNDYYELFELIIFLGNIPQHGVRMHDGTKRNAQNQVDGKYSVL